MDINYNSYFQDENINLVINKREELTPWTVGKKLVSLAIDIISTSMTVRKELIQEEVKKDEPDLGKITDILINIDTRTEYLLEEYQDRNIINEYNGYIEKLNSLMTMIQRCAKTPNEGTIKELKKSCKKNDIKTFITWIDSQNELKGKSLFEIAKKNFDLNETQEWKVLIAGRVEQAIFGYLVCYLVQNGEITFNHTILGKENDDEKGEIYELKNYLDKLEIEFKNLRIL